jgi:hypothetical protein
MDMEMDMNMAMDMNIKMDMGIDTDMDMDMNMALNIFFVLSRTETMDAVVPMSALAFSIPKPSYATRIPLYTLHWNLF